MCSRKLTNLKKKIICDSNWAFNNLNLSSRKLLMFVWQMNNFEKFVLYKWNDCQWSPRIRCFRCKMCQRVGFCPGIVSCYWRSLQHCSLSGLNPSRNRLSQAFLEEWVEFSVIVMWMWSQKSAVLCFTVFLFSLVRLWLNFNTLLGLMR